MLGNGYYLSLYESQTLNDDLIIPLSLSMGFSGVLVHRAYSGPVTCTPERVKRYNDRGLSVGNVAGSAGPSRWSDLADWAIAGIDACKRPTQKLNATGIDCEGSWDNNSKDEALKFSEKVLSVHPDAQEFLFDEPWPDPTDPYEHPNFPYKEFGLSCSLRLPMEYGAPVEFRTQLLAYKSTYGKGYPAIGNYRIGFTRQGYKCSVRDQLTFLLAYPRSKYIVNLWDYPELDRECICAFQCNLALENLGFTGPFAIWEFQKQAGLVVDGKCGEKTSQALGVDTKGVTKWFG